MSNKKQKQKVIQTEDSIEALKGLPSSIGKSVSEESKNLMSDLWKQMLNPDAMPQKEANQPQTQKQGQKTGDLRPGEELSLKEEKKLAHIEPGIDYSREIVHIEKKIQAQENQETKIRIQEIIVEIKKLTKSSKELEVKFKEVQAMERVPQNAGKYHANFVEWVLSMIRSAREKVDSTLSWTTALHSKKKQRQYWALFKKHGTSFALSGERYAVTQTG